MTTIRDLRSNDYDEWLPLWQAYIDFYRGEVTSEVTEQTFSLVTERRDGCFGLGAEAPDGTLVGIAHCVLHRTTWAEGPTCYLEDLFVHPRHRGHQTARALIQAARDNARYAGARTLYWHTQAFNAPARSLYDTLAHLTSFVHYEMPIE